MKDNNINKTIEFQTLSDTDKINELNKMIEEYKDSPKIVKKLMELKSSIGE